MNDQQNGPGRPRQPYPPAGVAAAGHLADRGTERLLAAGAHAAIAFGLLGIGFLLSLAFSGIIWLYGRRSPQVRFHSEQAGCYQCSVLLVNVVLVVLVGVGGGFSLFRAFKGESDWGASWLALAGLVVFLLWFVGTIVYGLVGASLVLAGKPFRYPIIGRRFEKREP